jgi:hypothetical protein
VQCGNGHPLRRRAADGARAGESDRLPLGLAEVRAMASTTSKVVVGVDGSPASLRALWFAVEQARQLYVSVLVVHVGGNTGSSILDDTAMASQNRSGPADRSHGGRVVEDALVELFGGIPADVPINLTISAPPIGPALV